MPRPVVYLAGPMGGMTWEESSAWREKVAGQLSPNWIVISPLKGQLETYVKSDDKIAVPERGETDLPINWTATGMVTQDLFYVDKSDFVLANFRGAERVSIGTIAELGYARGKNKYIVSVIPPDGIHDHPFVRRLSNIFVPTLEEALEFFKNIAI